MKNETISIHFSKDTVVKLTSNDTENFKQLNEWLINPTTNVFVANRVNKATTKQTVLYKQNICYFEYGNKGNTNE